MAVTDLDEKARRSSQCRHLGCLIGGCPAESTTALSRSVCAARFLRYGSLSDSLLTGDVMVHDKFAGIRSANLCPLAGLVSISLSLSFQSETAFKSSAAKGRKGNKNKKWGRKRRGGDARGKRNVPYNQRY